MTLFQINPLQRSADDILPMAELTDSKHIGINMVNIFLVILTLCTHLLTAIHANRNIGTKDL